MARKLRAAYAGALIRVRRSSDNVEADIGFLGVLLNQAAVAAHCGASTGFLVRKYDQTGNSRDLIQTADTTKQPMIYDGANVLLGSTGRPTSLYDGTNDWTRTPAADAGLVQPATTLDVFENNSWTSGGTVADGFGINSATIFQFDSANELSQFAGGSALISPDDYGIDTTVLTTGKWDGATSYLRKNNLARPAGGNPGNAPLTGHSVGARGDGSSPGAIRWSEGYVYPSEISDADQDLLAENIMAFYGIA